MKKFRITHHGYTYHLHAKDMEDMRNRFCWLFQVSGACKDWVKIEEAT